ncbi:MAG: hypothetical protein HOB40_04150 [Candidatus Marinimicrobia bacterium]|jgi:hypothetical protein|nr:hypothetical protein [Candidatus Neomarinimicrobiota bacterium]MBT4957572.1 hypothetical protein [Candidatus Neomarinimicrobiota bacterium]MBT6632140.1 hypothetical protein [Candidatus Neomarinimicrobiota bacterium]MBT6863691.1 hypothetical protein [Candidatus Neomarinimicrobiota bacterium]
MMVKYKGLIISILLVIILGFIIRMLTSAESPKTLNDYYTHIKGVEYIISVFFFIIFPLYYIHITKSD